MVGLEEKANLGLPAPGLTFGAFMPTRPRYFNEIPALEAAGYEQIWFPDFQLAGADPFLEIAIQAATTARMQFGVSVTNPVTRHVMVIANMMATLNHHYPGRVRLGVGVGEAPLRALGRPPATTSELVEFIRSCKALLKGESAVLSPNSGPVRFLESARTALNTVDPVPIVVAAGGPKSLYQAGVMADGVILGHVDPGLLEIQIAHIHEGARAAGRKEGDIQVTLLAGLFLAEPEPSLRTLREHVGGYVPNFLFSNRAAVQGHEDHLSRSLVQAFRLAAGLRERASATAQTKTGEHTTVFESYLEAVPDEYDVLVNRETIGAKVLFGTPDVIRNRLVALRGLGVSTIVLYPDPLDDRALATFADIFLRSHAGPAESDLGAA